CNVDVTEIIDGHAIHGFIAVIRHGASPQQSRKKEIGSIRPRRADKEIKDRKNPNGFHIESTSLIGVSVGWPDAFSMFLSRGRGALTKDTKITYSKGRKRE